MKVTWYAPEAEAFAVLVAGGMIGVVEVVEGPLPAQLQTRVGTPIPRRDHADRARALERPTQAFRTRLLLADPRPGADPGRDVTVPNRDGTAMLVGMDARRETENDRAKTMLEDPQPRAAVGSAEGRSWPTQQRR